MNGKASPKISFFAQSPNFCGVCAPAATSREVIETEVTLRNRGTPDGAWKVALLTDGRPNPRQCPHDELRQHWLVTRVAS